MDNNGHWERGGELGTLQSGRRNTDGLLHSGREPLKNYVILFGPPPTAPQELRTLKPQLDLNLSLFPQGGRGPLIEVICHSFSCHF